MCCFSGKVDKVADTQIFARSGKNGNFTTLELATKKSYKDKESGKYVSRTDWHKLIVFGCDAASPYGDINWPLKLGMPRGVLREPHLCVNSSQGLLQAAEEGCGIAALSDEHPGLESGGLIEVLPQIGQGGARSLLHIEIN